MGRGALILVEGLDRAGKTTQTSELVTRLRNEGLNVELIKFPGTFEQPVTSKRTVLTAADTYQQTEQHQLAS